MSLLAILLTLFSLSSTPAPVPAAPTFEIRIDVYPTSQAEYQLLKRATPESYTCKTFVSVGAREDRQGGSVFFTVARGGHETKTGKAGDYTITFAGKVNAKGDRADTIVTVSREGSDLARQSSTVVLQPLEARVVPLH